MEKIFMGLKKEYEFSSRCVALFNDLFNNELNEEVSDTTGDE